MSLRSTSNASAVDPVTLPDAPSETVVSGMLDSLVVPVFVRGLAFGMASAHGVLFKPSRHEGNFLFGGTFAGVAGLILVFSSSAASPPQPVTARGLVMGHLDSMSSRSQS